MGTPFDVRAPAVRASSSSRAYASTVRDTSRLAASASSRCWIHSNRDRPGGQSLRAASEAATGAKTLTQEGKAQARLNLQLELFYNLLEIAKAFPRQPEKLSLYMMQHLLENPSSPDEEEEPPPPPPGP